MSRGRRPCLAWWGLLLGLTITTAAGDRPDALPYRVLLPKVLAPSDDPVFGRGEFEYALTYGLVLSAAVAAGDQPTIDRARDWLLHDMHAGGWGTPWTWDPFGDGSETAAGTPFAITTAIAIQGLLDAGVTATTGAEIGSILVRWSRDAWSDGYYWYSLDPRDAIDTPNVNAMLAGVTLRYLAEAGDTLAMADRLLVSDRSQRSFEHLVAMRDAALRWRYSARGEVVNDLSHHVYILWGAELARGAGVSIPWDRAAALESIGRYGLVYPRDIALTPSMAARDGSPWEVSGSGVALAFSGRWGSPRDVLRWADATCTALDRAPFSPRFAAHALLGFAVARVDIC